VKPHHNAQRASEMERLRDIGLFAELTEITLTRIASAAILRHVEPGEHIVLEGDPSVAGYFILEGTVRIYRVSAEGREQVLVRLGPGQSFNTVPLFRPEGTNPAHAVALTSVTLYSVPREEFLHLVKTCSDLMRVVLEDFAGRLLHLTDLVTGLALHSVQERLARFLLDRAPGFRTGAVEGRSKGDDVEVRRWTQQQIAVHLGTVRDVVGRELRALEDAGIVRLERGRIVLLDRGELERLAGR